MDSIESVGSDSLHSSKVDVISSNDMNEGDIVVEQPKVNI